MFVVSVTINFLQAMLLCMLDPHEGMLAQQAVLTFDSMHAFVDNAADPRHQTQ